ncbi:hypothetical protein [Pectobacterium carotovorum]|uniref:hypothetical protein n=1 Tax=Pectobacterium carotovorum TaxID=554 RepID=UPI000D73DF8B|nr:hypothetical protein [Pectobacterium carotovorum]PXB01152.1 hypothetical protein DMB41_16280 [Pectobacterium carotovorum subsp. carotovorum]
MGDVVKLNPSANVSMNRAEMIAYLTTALYHIEFIHVEDDHKDMAMKQISELIETVRSLKPSNQGE